MVKALKRMGSGERDLRTVKEGANGGEDGSQEDWEGSCNWNTSAEGRREGMGRSLGQPRE